MVISSPKEIFSNLTLIKEYPNFIVGKYPLCLYRSKEKRDSFYRYHFGFPKNLVEPIHQLLESTPYWGEVHWKEDGNFWLWWTLVTSDGEELPLDSLNRELKWRIDSANDVIRLLKKAHIKDE